MAYVVSMWLYKSPKFRDSLEGVIKRIKEDEKFKQYNWLNFKFHESEGIGYMYSEAYVGDPYDEGLALDAWARMCYKYFFNEIILFKGPGNAVYYQYQEESVNDDELDLSSSFIRRYTEILLKRYDKPHDPSSSGKVWDPLR